MIWTESEKEQLHCYTTRDKNPRKILQGLPVLARPRKAFPRCLPILLSQFWFLANFLNDTVAQRKPKRFFISPSSRFELFFVSKIFESKATHDSNITEHLRVHIRFATLQAIRMPTAYKCPDRIYRSGQIFVIQLCVRIADRNWTCTSLYQHILISIDTRTKRLTSHAHALLCALTQVGLLVTYSISPTHWTRPQRPTSRLEGSLCATINGSSSYLTLNFKCYAMLEKDPGFILLLAFKCKECVQNPI